MQTLRKLSAFGTPLQMLQAGPPEEVQILQEPSALYPWLTPWDNPNTRST